MRDLREEVEYLERLVAALEYGDDPDTLTLLERRADALSILTAPPALRSLQTRRASLQQTRRNEGEPTSWEDNGYASREAMQAVHQLIANVFGSHRGSAFEIECGDGALLDFLRVQKKLDLVSGTDSDDACLRRGFLRHPQLHMYHMAPQQWVEGRPVSYTHTLLLRTDVLQTLRGDFHGLLAESAGRLLLYSPNGELRSALEQMQFPVPKAIARAHGSPAEAGVLFAQEVRNVVA
jgi:hypothetical protein